VVRVRIGFLEFDGSDTDLGLVGMTVDARDDSYVSSRYGTRSAGGTRKPADRRIPRMEEIAFVEPAYGATALNHGLLLSG
jgi:hypothetical protein